MPSFPIPVFGAIVLGFIAVQLWMRPGRRDVLVALMGLCAAQSLIIALVQHYGVEALRPVQPVTAAMIPPLSWVAFQSAAVRPLLQSDLWHAAGPVSVLLALAFFPLFLDVLLPALFIGYGILIIIAARSGTDNQPNAVLASGDMPALIWQVIGGTLLASALSDVLIVASQIAGYPGARGWIISVFVGGNLLLVGILGLSPHLFADTPDLDEPPQRTPVDPDLWNRIEAHMRDHRPYLDPDLTLARMARKLTVPAKAVSSTINAATGHNVSRYINAARIAAAQAHMSAGMGVTEAIYASGFNTKSNFNREFKRITGQSPSAWRANADG